MPKTIPLSSEAKGSEGNLLEDLDEMIKSEKGSLIGNVADLTKEGTDVENILTEEVAQKLGVKEPDDKNAEKIDENTREQFLIDRDNVIDKAEDEFIKTVAQADADKKIADSTFETALDKYRNDLRAAKVVFRIDSSKAEEVFNAGEKDAASFHSAFNPKVLANLQSYQDSIKAAKEELVKASGEWMNAQIAHAAAFATAEITKRTTRSAAQNKFIANVLATIEAINKAKEEAKKAEEEAKKAQKAEKEAAKEGEAS